MAFAPDLAVLDIQNKIPDSDVPRRTRALSRGRAAALSCSLGAHALVAAAFAMNAPHDPASALGSWADTDSAIEVTLVSGPSRTASSAVDAETGPKPIANLESILPVSHTTAPPSSSPRGEASTAPTSAASSASETAAAGYSAPGDVTSAARDLRDPAADAVGREYRRRLLAHIQPYRRYPRDAHGDGGAVQLLFVIQRSGAVTGVWVTRSSGVVVLDDAAVQTLMRAQPLPPIPAALPDSVSVSLPVAFDAP
ncbi:TonB family protein [Caulobacter sp.]|uniref:TonB family protein n=1 Tax=Caulobacter sp. TaxID=78 RepID=UPI003BAED6C1